jgi:hypothetical protein
MPPWSHPNPSRGMRVEVLDPLIPDRLGRNSPDYSRFNSSKPTSQNTICHSFENQNKWDKVAYLNQF